MNYWFNSSKNKVSFKIEDDKELAELHEINKTAQTAGSQILDKHHEYGRETIIEAIKECGRDAKIKDLVWTRIGVLIGYDDHRMLKEEMIGRLNAHMEKKKEEEEFEKDLNNTQGGEEIL